MMLFILRIIMMFRRHQDSVEVDFDDLDFLLAKKVLDLLKRPWKEVSHLLKHDLLTQVLENLPYKGSLNLDQERLLKQPVRDHCHFTGKYRGPAHNECNRQFRKPKFTPIFFHNLSGYDPHLFIKNLGKTQGNIKCIPNNEERYISFSKNI